MSPILNIQKSITNTAVLVFFFLLALFIPVYAQNNGTPYYGTADGDLLSGSECTIGFQKPSVSKECASCNVKNMSGFRDFFVNSGMGKCNNQQIINYWIRGGIGAAGPHNFYEGDIAPHICKSVCACELADRNADCGDKTALIPTRIPTVPPTPTMRPTLIPTTISLPTPEENLYPTSYYEEPETPPSPTEEAIQMKLKGSNLVIDAPKTDNQPKVALSRINIKEKATVAIRFITSIFTRFFKEASF